MQRRHSATPRRHDRINTVGGSPRHPVNILCNGVLCKQTKAMKYLGITIDDKLKWDSHMSNNTKKVSFNNARLRRIRPMLPREILIKIFNTMTIPIIDYACTVVLV